MTPEDIIREAIAYTELVIKQLKDTSIEINRHYKLRKEFPSQILAILKDEVY